MQSVEFKAELRDPFLALAVLRRIPARIAATSLHEDEHLRTITGRLLRRRAVTADGDVARAVLEEADRPRTIEYIRYERADRPQPKLSRFVILSEAQARERFGEAALPVRVRLVKLRRTAVIGPVRCHLDEVDGLGRFIEIDALVTRLHNLAAGHAAIADIRRMLAPALGEPIAVGYAEMARTPRGEAAPAGAAD